MNKICYFETPEIPAAWGVPEINTACCKIIFSNPVTPCDIYLKNQYFGGVDEQGLGTILIGVKTDPSHISATISFK